jgi:hypothetical protein
MVIHIIRKSFIVIYLYECFRLLYLKNKVKHENLPTRIYEFDYVGYEDTKQKIDFNENKSYLKNIAKEVEDEMKQKNNI